MNNAPIAAGQNVEIATANGWVSAVVVRVSGGVVFTVHGPAKEYGYSLAAQVRPVAENLNRS